jgi:D-3-phosphoglycerate dehydrogenase
VPSTRIVITDCDHDSITQEQEVAAEHDVELRLEQCRTEDDVIEAAADADGVLVQYAPISARVLDALPRLKAIGRYGVGVDTVDVDAATKHGVAVCNVPDYGTEDVSDHAIALALNLVRGVTEFDRRLRTGQYDFALGRPLHRIRTRTFGVVGLGRIGSATARKAHGVGFNVVGCDPQLPMGSTTPAGVRVVSFEEVLETADVVSLHLPLTATTHHLIDSAALRLMRHGAMLVNTSRGALVDTKAAAEALSSGALRGGAFDVFEEEPLPLDDPLIALDNAVLTPHVAWYSEESYGELKRRAIQNIVDVCARRPPRDVVNPEVLAWNL